MNTFHWGGVGWGGGGGDASASNKVSNSQIYQLISDPKPSLLSLLHEKGWQLARRSALAKAQLPTVVLIKDPDWSTL